MKKKKISKKVLAVLLSFIMIATSVPLGIIGTAAGTYDPAPYFSEDAIKAGADAWLDDEGNVQVTFPAATPMPTYKGEPTTITFYILELVDMGAKSSVHQDKVLKQIKVEGTSGTFAAADIGKIDLENNRYSVTITAVDSENWFSQSIYVTVSDVPAVELDAERFTPFSSSATAVREIMTFDRVTSDDGAVSGDQLLYMGTTAQTGTDNLSSGYGDTVALRFAMYDQPTGTQAFDTSYSRQTWDFNGAEEIWYWMDLTEVELTGLAFRLRTNEKLFIEWKSGTIETVQRTGETVYSTKGTAASTYTGEDPYVYVQREDGGWDKIMLKDDGTIDLGYFKGYVRVPLDFICSETATYVDISNQEFGQEKSFTSGATNTVNENNAFSWMAGMTFSQKVLVDNPGTPISDALLIHRRVYKTKSGFLNLGTSHTFTWNINGQTHYTEDVSNYDYSKIGYMIGMPLDTEMAKTSITTGNASTDRAYVSGTTVMNREGGIKAIEDIYTTGFSIEGCTADSLSNDFYIDNIFFYRSDGKAYSENTLDGNVNTGNSMVTYYNEELEISKIIFDEIDKYIEDPDWADYREITYILDLIEGYRKIYAANGKFTNFLSLDKTDDGDGVGLAAAAAKLNRDSWAVAWEAYEACAAAGTLGSANADKHDLIPLIVKTLEKMPKAADITSVSDVLRTEIVKLWKAYSLLNLGQLEMLGEPEEKELLALFALIEDLEATDGNEFVVGQQLADFPYIVYNDFENKEVGTKGWQLEDDRNAYDTSYVTVDDGAAVGTGNLTVDWRHLKDMVTYTTYGETNITNKGDYGFDESLKGMVYYDAAEAEITQKGYMNSNAATVNIDASFTADNQDGVFHTITLTRQGKDSASWADFQANKMELDGLGNFATSNVTGATSIGLSLIFYVDFTELESFYFTTNIFSKNEGADHKFRVDMGNATLGNITDSDAYKQEHWKYFILDPNTGEWKINHTTSQWCFTSTQNASWGDELSLDGYRGYLMVPLYHIKSGETVLDGSDKLDCNSDWLNNIYAIQFCIGGANENTLDEKSFTIDNVGFTYDPAGYAAHDWNSYAEVFEAKSLPALNFEEMVDAIDIYDDATLATDGVTLQRNYEINQALTAYAALPTYQQSVVADAYNTLLYYKDIIDGKETLQEPVYTPTQLNDLIAALPDAAKTATVTGDNDIIYPGYTNGQVNYSSYGLDAEMAATIISYYKDSYAYYSNVEKAAIDSTSLLNAYRAAMRTAATLESIKSDAVAFLPELTAMYERKEDADGNLIGNFVSIASREEVQTFWDTEYHPLQYYSKTSIDDGSIYAQLTNTSRGLTYFLKNTETYTFGEGESAEVIEGGILTFRDKMQDIYDMANDHITNKTLFTEEELQSVRDIIQEYNALLPAYYNIEELYELEQAILALFPEYQTSMGEQTLMLSEENLSKSTVYTIEYSEYLDITDPYTDTLYVKVVSQNGYMTNDYGDIVNYNVTLESNEYNPYTVDASQLAGLPDANWAATYPVTNNASTPDGTQEAFTLTAGVSAAQTGLHGMVTDVLTLQLCHPDGTVLEEQTVQVFYSMGDAYTVTIPAEFPVSWDDSDPQDVSYTANTEMNAASSIKVKVSSDGTGKLTNTVTQDVLTYATENFDVETTFSGMITDGEQDPAPTVTVSGWDDVPVGEYRTTLTYTVEYDDGTT